MPGALEADSFAPLAGRLRDRLNRDVAAGTVTDVEVVVRSARDMSERGCTDLKPARTEAARN